MDGVSCLSPSKLLVCRIVVEAVSLLAVSTVAFAQDEARNRKISDNDGAHLAKFLRMQAREKPPRRKHHDEGRGTAAVMKNWIAMGSRVLFKRWTAKTRF